MQQIKDSTLTNKREGTHPGEQSNPDHRSTAYFSELSPKDFVPTDSLISDLVANEDNITRLHTDTDKKTCFTALLN